MSLANVTAETFVQSATNNPIGNNCFTCHNATSYGFQKSPPPLKPRLIALSHVLSIGTPYAVPNLISGSVGGAPELPVGEIELRKQPSH